MTSMILPESVRKYLTQNQYHRERWCAIFGVLWVASQMSFEGTAWGVWAAFPILVFSGLELNGSYRASPLLRLAGMAGCVVLGGVAAIQFYHPASVLCVAYSFRCLRVGVVTYRDARACLNVD